MPAMTSTSGSSRDPQRVRSPARVPLVSKGPTSSTGNGSSSAVPATKSPKAKAVTTLTKPTKEGAQPQPTPQKQQLKLNSKTELPPFRRPLSSASEKYFTADRRRATTKQNFIKRGINEERSGFF